MKSFEGKVAVITGAGSCIRQSLAKQLIQTSSHLALCDLDHDRLFETVTYLENKSSAVTLHTVDISDQAQMYQPILMIFKTNYSKKIDINMWGVAYDIRSLLPHLKTRPEASIITLSSLAGMISLSSYSPFAMNKFITRALSESLAMELSSTPIHELIVFPGGVKTHIIQSAPNLDDLDREPAHQAFYTGCLTDIRKAVEKNLQAAKKKRHRLILGVDTRLAYLVRRLFPQSYPKILNAVFGRTGFV